MIRLEVGGADTVALVQSALRDVSQRRMAAAVATALTRTAVAARAAVAAEMGRVFDAPTPYTMRQLRYVPATAARPVAAVGFNVVAIQDVMGRVMEFRDLGPGQTPAGRYLTPQIEGGSRAPKRLEEALRAAGALPKGWFAVPGQGAGLDAFGNMRVGQVRQVLSQLRLQTLAGSSSNMREAGDAGAIRAQRRAGGRFFVVPPGGDTQPGVYQREFFGRNVTPVLIFVRSVTYRRRFDFEGVVSRVARLQLPFQVRRALDETIARAAGRGRA